MKWIDAHCHLADPRLDLGRDALLAQARVAGIGRWIQGGVDPADWDRQLELVARYPGEIVPVFGLHPWRAALSSESAIKHAVAELEKRLEDAPLMGEMGLDLVPRHADGEGLGRQELAFRLQLELAKRSNKPLVLHVVRGHEQALRYLTEAGELPAGGLIHSFSGPYETAKAYVDLGFLVSVGTAVCRLGHAALKAAIKRLPASALVVETDSPDQAIAGAGALNEPVALLEVARAVASLRGVSREEILDTATENMNRILRGL